MLESVDNEAPFWNGGVASPGWGGGVGVDGSGFGDDKVMHSGSFGYIMAPLGLPRRKIL